MNTWPLVNNTFQNYFFIFQRKHMLWVPKRTVSLSLLSSYWHPKHMLKIMGKKYLPLYAEKIVYLNLCTFV